MPAVPPALPNEPPVSGERHTEPALDGDPRDCLYRILHALRENARANTAFLQEDIDAWRRTGHTSGHLAWRREVAAMIDDEVLGTLISFAHPADIPLIFECLAEMRDEPRTVRLAAGTLAEQYVMRGFEHVGCRIADVPLWQHAHTNAPLVT